MKFGYFDTDPSAARCHTNIGTVGRFDVTRRNTSERAAHLFHQTYLFVFLVLACHRSELPNTEFSGEAPCEAPASSAATHR
jgi:hypothetical protein